MDVLLEVGGPQDKDHFVLVGEVKNNLVAKMLVGMNQLRRFDVYFDSLGSKQELSADEEMDAVALEAQRLTSLPRRFALGGVNADDDAVQDIFDYDVVHVGYVVRPDGPRRMVVVYPE